MKAMYACECGFTWAHGKDGSHQCGPHYRQRIKELERPWISVEQAVPDSGEQVIVTSQGWGSPQVLEYNETPWPRFLDRYEGRWYWYPERMHWMRFPPAPQGDQQ
jgi:hypothetical protein